MNEENLNNKILQKKKECPMCKKDFIYFCLLCYENIRFSPDSIKTIISTLIVNINTIINCPSSSYFVFFMVDFKDKIKFLANLCRVDLELIIPMRDKITLSLKEKSGEAIESDNDHVAPKQSQKTTSDASVTSHKSKKSGILSNLIRITRRKKEKSVEDLKESIDQESNSTHSLSSFKPEGEEAELHSEYYSKDEGCDTLQNRRKNEDNFKTDVSESEISLASSPLFKIPSLSKSAEMVTEERALTTQTFFNDDRMKMVTHQTQKKSGKGVTVLPLAYLKSKSRTLNLNLAEGLNELQKLVRNLKDSEANLVHMINKYIENPEVKKELVEVMSQHTILHWEVEKRTNSLAAEMWMQQTEIFKCQEKTLQENLFSLIKQNRLLQTDNDILTRRNEKMMLRIKSIPEYVRPRMFDPNGRAFENITKNNEKQQRTIECLIHQVETLEKELQLLQKENETLQQSKNNYSCQLDNYKSVIQRMKTDNELEKTTLSVQIKNYQQIVKETMETGEVILEDAEALGKQLREIQIPLNWSKFKCRGSSTTDLIHFCRCCINELGRELITSHTQRIINEKDLATLRETNTRLQENLRKSATELDNISRIIQDNKCLQNEMQRTYARCSELEVEISNLKNTLSKMKDELSLEKASSTEKSKFHQQILNELEEQKKNLSDNKLVVSTLTSDNCSLRNQLESLKELLNRNNARDLDKEILFSKQKIEGLQENYNQITIEKNSLMGKLEKICAEKEELIKSHEMFYKQAQSIQENVELLSEENSVLKQNIEEMHITIISLQAERKRYLEEKNVLKSIFTQLKKEIERCQTLEGTVVDMSNEANRLAMIAEFNRKLGERLKHELEERESTIVELRSSVEKLNNAQIETNKDKISLCIELSEVNKIKDQLNHNLERESQKVMKLHETNKNMEVHTSVKLQELHMIQINSQKEMDHLLESYWMVIQEKNDLVRVQSRIKNEVQTLKSETELREKTYKKILIKNNETEMSIQSLSEKVESQDKIIRNLTEEIQNESRRYEKATRSLEGVLKQTKKEKENMEKTVEYLKNNCQKLTYDLNEARACLKEREQILKAEIKKYAILEKTCSKLEKDSTNLYEEKKRLSDELNHMHKTCEKLLKDLEEKLSDALQKEGTYKNDIFNFKTAIDSYENELTRLNTILKEKENDGKHFLSRIESLKKENTELTLTISSSDLQTRFERCRNEKKEIEEKLLNLKLEHESRGILIDNMKKELERLHKEIDQIVKQKNEDNDYFKTHLDELAKEYNERKMAMKDELAFIRDQLASLTEELTFEKCEKNKLLKDHKDLSSKLMTTIQTLFNEKANKREAVAKISELRATIAKMKAERECLKLQSNALMASIEEEKNKIISMEQDQVSCSLVMEEIRQKYEEILSKIKSVNKNLKDEGITVVANQADEINQTFMDGKINNDERETHLTELDKCYGTIAQLREEISLLRHQQTCLEFQKCEITLRLHEVQGNLKIEKDMYTTLKSEYDFVLSVLTQLRDQGKLAPVDFDCLIERIQSSTNLKKVKSTSNLIK